MDLKSCPPVLFLIFNRPDLTNCVFERIREAKPKHLFVAADGARPDHAGDAELCAETRQIIKKVDWDCELRTLFREQNLGCKQAVSSAITWFFKHVEQGIILEDDCLPDMTFFRFCSELLGKYRHDERVMAISGNNFQNGEFDPGSSCYFSIYNHIWGWATWRRAWRHYDGKLTLWPRLRESGWLEGWLQTIDAAAYWCNIFDSVYAGQINSWGYPWTFACWAQHGLSVLPAINLVSNIGFDNRATHTKAQNSPVANLPALAMDFPLVYPSGMVRQYKADSYTATNHFGISKKVPLIKRALRKSQRLLSYPFSTNQCNRILQ